MTQPAHADPNGGLLKNEPVVIAHFVLWLLFNLGLIVVGRYHLVSPATWNALSSALAPQITAFILALSAWFWRQWVTPAWKLVQAQQVPVSPPPDVALPVAAPAVAVDTSDADAALAAVADLTR